jgi:hypothetical protein
MRVGGATPLAKGGRKLLPAFITQLGWVQLTLMPLNYPRDLITVGVLNLADSAFSIFYEALID